MKTRIAIPRFVDDPSLPIEERFRRLEEHHQVETKFLISKIEEFEQDLRFCSGCNRPTLGFFTDRCHDRFEHRDCAVKDNRTDIGLWRERFGWKQDAPDMQAIVILQAIEGTTFTMQGPAADRIQGWCEELRMLLPFLRRTKW